MNAPTEAEVRALVERELAITGMLNPAGEAADAFAAIQAILLGLYDEDELRASEDAELLSRSAAATEPIYRQAMADCIEALVAAGVAFATAHPDAPRKPRADARRAAWRPRVLEPA